MTKDLTPEQLRHVMHGISVPPQPQILVDIHMEQAMPNPDICRITDLISRDVGLAGTVLKVVNSDIYGLKNKITSISQAVRVLGLSCVINIVNGLSIKSEMSDETVVALTGFWDTAMDIAATASTLSKQIGFQAPDVAYSLGLFHNCGVPLLYKHFSHYQTIIELSYGQSDERIIDTENRELQTNHAVLGSYVARSWRLPIEMCEVIAEHHNVDAIFNGALRENYDPYKKTLLAILKMAEHICGCYRILGAQSMDYEWERIKTSLLEYVGLSEIDFEDLEANFVSLGIGSTSHSFFDKKLEAGR
ncbi:MAG TPA: HDOD domain-containing protein [Pseudomonadales bacterium]|nr:HDOD domain-containing protein [Pseudomonadales bacterium]